MQDSPGDSASGKVRAAWSAPGAILACLLWSSAFAVVKIGLAYVQPLTFAGWRFMLAGCLLIPLCGRRRGGGLAVVGHWRLITAVSLLQTVVLYGAFFLGMNLVSGAQGAIVVGSSPLVAALMAHVLMKDDRMTFGKAGAIAVGMVGVAVIAMASEPWSPTGLKELAGMGLLMLGVCSSALANILVARSHGAMNPVVLNSLQMGLGGVILSAIAAFAEGLPSSLPPGRFFVALLWLATVSAAGFSIWFALLKYVKVSRLNMWKFLMPIFGAILSWLLISTESPDVPTVAGMIFVSAGILLGNRKGAGGAQMGV